MIDLNNNVLPINRNNFKNPNFAVIQGAASGTIANSLALPTASLGYLGETEWAIAASGSTPAYAFSAANESVTFTGTTGTTAIYLLQRLESKDMVSLANRLATMTFSVEISNSLLTSVIWEVFRPTTSDDTHGTIASPTQTLIASGTFTVSSTLTRYSASFSLPALASRGLEVRLRVGAQTTGTWVVSRLQLEEGNIANNFRCENYASELLRCLRYYEIIRFADGITIGVGSTGATYSPPQANGVYFPWKTIKFAAPVAASSTSSTFFVAGSVASGAVTLSADTSGITTNLTASSGNTGANWTCVHVSTGPSAYLAGSSHIP